MGTRTGAGPSRYKAPGALADFGNVVADLLRTWFDPYRPEQHYMRGPGPKWHAKHHGFRPVPELVRVRVKR
ncbi:MAG TPA: hypothetical protein VH934_15645 [Xanthobacteraceae bacterium]|jgi:hypothetical protein